MTPVTVRDLVLAARGRLARAGIEPVEAAMDAELLAREVLGWDRARFLAHHTDRLETPDADRISALIARRARREPVSAIVGRREFRGLEFEVTRDVLTPRPETEIVVDEAIARAVAPRTVADVGTGSGCLAICLARALPASRIVATDVSEAALGVARRNAARHGVLGQIEFRHASLLSGVAGPLDLVVSNPPYVPTGDIASLPVEVRDFEPRQALDGGEDGLDLLRRLCRESAGLLRPGGWAIVEFGFGQETGVRAAVADAGLELAAIRLDLQGIPRTAVSRRR